jgi:hypothetical protein
VPRCETLPQSTIAAMVVMIQTALSQSLEEPHYDA